MDIYEYAMRMEQENERYYRDLAASCSNTGLKTILHMLADEEVRHFGILQEMRERTPEIVESERLLSRAKDIFAQMRGQQAFTCGTSQLDLYRKAQEIEQKAHSFYLEQAKEEQGERQKQTFKRIADEEQKHYLLLGHIVEFLSRPQQWLEDAEWQHLDEY